MPSFRDAAVVLRTYKLGEADRIIVMLGQQQGLVRAVAKGVRRTKSKFGPALEPGNVVDVQCFAGRNLDTVQQAVLVAPYGSECAKDYGAWTAAAAILGVAAALAEAQEHHQDQFVLLVGALSAVAAGELPADLVADSFVLRALSAAGWGASFIVCARCGAPGPHQWFAASQGGVLCVSCAGEGVNTADSQVFLLLNALLESRWEQAVRFSLLVRRHAGRLISSYVRWHLERDIASLALIERSARY